MDGIYLTITEDSPPILRIARLTGQKPDRVYLAVIRWFMWVGTKCKSEQTEIDVEMFEGLTKWQPHGTQRDASLLSLAAAMQTVGWLSITPVGTIKVEKYHSFFSPGAVLRRVFASIGVVVPDGTRKWLSRKCPDFVQELSGPPTPPGGVLDTEDGPIPCTGSEKKPRTRDAIWDTVADLWHGGSVPPSLVRKVGKAVRDLKACGATPAGIRAKYEAAQAAWQRPFGPEALVKHWGMLASDGFKRRDISDSEADRLLLGEDAA
jgi:hypothetical protein